MIIDTLTFSNKSQGWASRWSYRPDWMIGLNSSFYSFKNGNLYQHDINQTHTEFYGNIDGFSVSTIFNESPVEIKMFKTLAIDGSTGLNVTGYTDLDQVEMSIDQFKKKEGKFYAYLRRPQNELDLELISSQGIGSVVSTNVNTIEVSNSFSNVDIGDKVYKATFTPASNPEDIADIGNISNVLEVGTISAIGSNSITTSSSFINTPNPGDYLFIVKESSIESYGARGYYLNLTLSLSGSEAANNHEVFAIKSSVFKSFP